MAQSITIYVPDAPVTYEIGVDSVQNINVHFYFANVVHIVIFFVDGSQKAFYQVPCVLSTPAP